MTNQYDILFIVAETNVMHLKKVLTNGSAGNILRKLFFTDCSLKTKQTKTSTIKHSEIFSLANVNFYELFQLFIGEFDPGSGRTLAACLIHASRTIQRTEIRGRKWEKVSEQARMGTSGLLASDLCLLDSGGRVSNTWATCP